MTTTLAQSVWLKAQGFPQDQWPQMVWHLSDDSDGPFLEYWPLGFLRAPFENIAAPDVVSGDPAAHPGALEWLEQEKGWRWWRSPHAYNPEETWLAIHGKENPLISFTSKTARELLDRIMEASK